MRVCLRNLSCADTGYIIFILFLLSSFDCGGSLSLCDFVELSLLKKNSFKYTCSKNKQTEWRAQLSPSGLVLGPPPEKMKTPDGQREETLHHQQRLQWQSSLKSAWSSTLKLECKLFLIRIKSDRQKAYLNTRFDIIQRCAFYDLV